MQTTWLVAADASRARIFQVLEDEHRLEQIDDFENPQGRLHERDIDTDLQGRFHARGSPDKGQSAREPEGVEHATELFSKRLGQYLDKARNDHRYERLYLVAPPKFLGLLRHNLGSEVQKLVSEEIAKDLSWFTPREIERHVRGAGSPRI